LLPAECLQYQGPTGPRRLASDKLFFFLFQSNPDLILRWLACLHRRPSGRSCRQ
jgi:hypothetical protein